MRFLTILCAMCLSLCLSACGGEDGDGGNNTVLPPVGSLTCAGTSPCDDQGKCTMTSGDRCIVTRYSECENCAATRDSDCRNSEFCRDYGLCSLVGGECIAATDADCEQAQCCKNHMEEECTAKDGECVYP